MEIYYFSTEHKENKLLRAMKAALPEKQITTFLDTEKLRDDLDSRVESRTVAAVLFASTEEALLDIYCIHHVFYRVSTILVLPNRDECFQALAYRMKPNFLFYADSREEDIVSVITEMTGETRKMTTINERRVQNIAKNFATAMPHYYEDRVSNM